MLSARKICLPFIVLVLAGSFTLFAQDWKQFPYSPEGSLITFPSDEGWHPGEDVEWWYIAGHLEGRDSGIPYSFMLTYFYYPGDTFGISYDGFRILNLANDQSGEFHTETMLVLNYNELDTGKLHIDAQLFNSVDEFWLQKEENDGTLIPFEYELSALAGNSSLSLSAHSRKRPLILGEDGLFNQGASSYTYYYSLTDVWVEGSLNFEGTSEEVVGPAWIDHQYGSFNPNTEEAYEWFYLQLSNGMDLNIWNLFTSDQQLPDDPAYRHLSAYVDEETQYTSHEFKLERLAWDLMPATTNCYAQRWSLQSEQNQLDLTITTLHHNSEVLLPFAFFEGPVEVSGTANGSPVTGIGFAELVKTYEAPRIELVEPHSFWNENLPILWELENPDAGRPVLYELSYSITGEEPWNSIVSELIDTLFYWNDHTFTNGDSCWFKVGAYTQDRTLQGFALSPEILHYDDSYNSIDQKVREEAVDAGEIYPNPAADRIWLSQTEYFNHPYRIVDLTGRVLLKGKITGDGLDIRTLEKGSYFLLVNDSKKYTVWKFIKN